MNNELVAKDYVFCQFIVPVEKINKKIRKKCEHGKQKSRCKECGGSAFCEHGKWKSHCKECGGSLFCEHEKRKSRCNECGGSAFCEHGKHKSSCRYCCGSAFCEHGKRKSICKECGGSGICEHGRQKSHCKECGSSSFCQHEKQKSKCKECGGSAFCEHGKEKSKCKECGGSGICEHEKQKSQCKECGGSSFCEHGKHKSQCKECGGSAICKHGKQKSQCKECGGSSLCKSSFCDTHGNKRYNGYCVRCCLYLFPDKVIARNYKTKENCVVDNVKESFPNLSWISDKKIQDGCSKRRPDLLLDMGSHIIIIEVDENKHSTYDCSCENKRLMELSRDLDHRPIIFLRFNPDGYVDENEVEIKSCWSYNSAGFMRVTKKKEGEWKNRLESLMDQINYWMNNDPTRTVTIVELFY